METHFPPEYDAEMEHLCANCQKPLIRRQKRYCSYSCRNKQLSPGNKGGAPTKYRHAFARRKLEQYLDLCERESEPTFIPTKHSFIFCNNVHLPSRSDFALYLGFSRQTLDGWAQRHWAFAEALDRIHSEQKTYLINLGLAWRINTSMALFLLKTNHGMRPQYTTPDFKPIGVIKYLFDPQPRATSDVPMP